ncbi:polysaccharide deacetylase family protein [Streptomyces sp. JH14]|uniref:polysaccharide deacetylase family protein n=1 Tax=Streptomyces sp. JH14 TaxID=2793630 RepID=UPI0023F888B4|nr:polysaccharide deacetylase family protein [Streptomyces sp. JH14]MDF6040698.1 polysaccharide deacetylase family protein [Streptomyces sp. JH14]
MVRRFGTGWTAVSPGAAAAAAGLAAGVAAACHIGPAATWLPPVRRILAPALDGRGHRTHVALTFDDGPDPASTPHFLHVLEEHRVRATFFVVGSALERHPALGRALVAGGHEVAVHGWQHERPWFPTPLRDAREVTRTAAAVQDICGTAPQWYRPPYGILTGGRLAAARRAGLRPVLWSAWGRDWTAHADTRSVRASVLADLTGGGTVLLHDADGWSAPGAWRATLAALPRLLTECSRLGLTVGPLAEHGIGHADIGTHRRRARPPR